MRTMTTSVTLACPECGDVTLESPVLHVRGGEVQEPKATLTCPCGYTTEVDASILQGAVDYDEELQQLIGEG